MDILTTGLQGFVFGVALAALVLLVLDIHLRTDAHLDARRRADLGDKWWHQA
jgi:hypothetical protein